MLRLLDMPLPEVGRVVSASRTEAAEIIDSYWASAESRFAAQRQVMDILRPGVAASEMPAKELTVRERDVAAQTVLTEQRHVYIGQLTWTREAAARLTRSCLCAVRRRSGRAFGDLPRHGHRRQRRPGRSVRPGQGHPPRDPAELAWRVEPAHREAYIPVTRTHFEIPAIWSIYDRLARWVAAPGRSRAGAPREVYRPEAEPLFTPAGQQICDVAVPFATSHQPGSSRSDLPEQATARFKIPSRVVASSTRSVTCLRSPGMMLRQDHADP